MPLKVVGAGLGRTGTHSLKLALERLLGEPCYHMIEVFGHPEHVGMWHQAVRGDMPDWDELFAGYGAAVDRSEEHTSELQSQSNLVCRLLLEKKKKTKTIILQTQEHTKNHQIYSVSTI